MALPSARFHDRRGDPFLAPPEDHRALGRWSEPTLALFPAEGDSRSLTGRRELARMPKVLQHREKTSVSGDLLDWARVGVDYRHREPDLQLVDWVNAAFRAALDTDAARSPGYPTMQQALHQRYGNETTG